jgi:hypothetical protein
MHLFGNYPKNELFLPLLKLELAKIKNYTKTLLKLDLVVLTKKDTNMDYLISNPYYSHHITDEEHAKVYFKIPDEILTDIGYILTNKYKQVSALTKKEIKNSQPEHFDYYFKSAL